MLIYDLDQVISDLMDHEETRLSAEARNTINFCRSTHPCCGHRTEMERINTVSCAIAGRNVHPVFRERLERLAAQAIEKEAAA